MIHYNTFDSPQRWSYTYIPHAYLRCGTHVKCRRHNRLLKPQQFGYVRVVVHTINSVIKSGSERSTKPK